MPITFEEVTADIQPAEPGGATGASTPQPAAPDDDFRKRLEAELRLMSERSSRLSAA
jgi:hypothetical protein